MIVKFSIFLFIILLANSQRCYPNFLVQQIFQNTVHLQFTKQEKQSSQLTKIYNHSYWGDAFTQQPNIAFCISQLQLNPAKTIQYRLEATVHTSAIQFSLSSKGIKWGVLSIHLWLYNRKDFYSQTITSVSSSSNQLASKSYSSSTKIKLPSLLLTKINKNTGPIYQSFLIGLRSTSTSLSPVHNILITDTLTDDTYTLQIQTNYNNQILQVRVIVVIVPTQTSEYVSYQIDFEYQNLQQSYQLLNGRFHPVMNLLLGLKSITLKNEQTFSLRQEYDMVNSLMRIATSDSEDKNTNKPNVEFVQLSFLSFGRLMQQVCSPCVNSYVGIDGCKAQCDQGYHSKIYYNFKGQQSGRACVKCLSEVNMQYNSELKVCLCENGYLMSGFGTKCRQIASQPTKFLNSDVQINTNFKQQCPIQGMTFINGTCQCSTSLFMIDGKCQICPSPNIYESKLKKCISQIQANGCKGLNQQPNINYTQCVCKSGFQRFNSSCVAKCQQNYKRNSQTGNCECIDGYEQVLNKDCLKKCNLNQIRNAQGNCVCISGFSLNSASAKCQKTVQKSTSVNVNSSIIKNSSTAQTQTKTQTQTQTQASTPTATSTTTTSAAASTTTKPLSATTEKMKILVDPTTPIYTNPGIIVDFLITPVISRTKDEVEKMFQISFSDQKQAPHSLFISQNENDRKSYRVYLYYANSLPYKPFSATFKVKDQRVGEDQITLPIDPLKNGIVMARRGDSNILQ